MAKYVCLPTGELLAADDHEVAEVTGPYVADLPVSPFVSFKGDVHFRWLVCDTPGQALVARYKELDATYDRLSHELQELESKRNVVATRLNRIKGML